MKTFIGPQLRRLRRERAKTQSEIAKDLGISPSYVNLLENNERSISVSVLLKLLEVYGVDWRDVAETTSVTQLSNLRGYLQDPLFDKVRPDLSQLRAAQSHSPDLLECFFKLYQSHAAITEHVLNGSDEKLTSEMASSTPEASIYSYFSKKRNYFDVLEAAASKFFGGETPPRDEIYSWIKLRLKEKLSIQVRLVRVTELKNSLRLYDAKNKEVLISEALDHPNRIFQLLHVGCLIEHDSLLDQLVEEADFSHESAEVRCKVELANYFAAAVLMPYDEYLMEASTSKFDFDQLATRFGVNFEQACHRAATLQRPNSTAVPFFFFRIDRAGNVSKRINSTNFQLGEYGGACPRLDVHNCFKTPDKIVPQLVEMPDQSQYLIFSRTVDRPTSTRHSQDNRLAIAIGCSVDHARHIGYADELHLTGAKSIKIGINCRVCPRSSCEQRAQHGLALQAIYNTHSRGSTRYDN